LHHYSSNAALPAWHFPSVPFAARGEALKGLAWELTVRVEFIHVSRNKGDALILSLDCAVS